MQVTGVPWTLNWDLEPGVQFAGSSAAATASAYGVAWTSARTAASSGVSLGSISAGSKYRHACSGGVASVNQLPGYVRVAATGEPSVGWSLHCAVGGKVGGAVGVGPFVGADVGAEV